MTRAQPVVAEAVEPRDQVLGLQAPAIPALTVLAQASEARTGLDLFCGTTRVAQAWKGLGLTVTAVDSARVAHLLARCYVATTLRPYPGSGPRWPRPLTASTTWRGARAT